MKFLASLVTLVGVIAGGVWSLDLESELKRLAPFCGPVPVAPNVDVSWIQKEEIWYFPYATRSEVFLWTYTVLKNEIEVKSMTAEYARTHSCYIMNFKSDFDAFGFGRKLLQGKSQLYFNPVRPGVVDWEYEGEYAGSSYILKTDNSTYAVGMDIFPDGSRGGYVMTPYSNVKERFSKAQVEEWKKVLAEVGFDEESVMELPVDCSVKFWEEYKRKNLHDILNQETTTTSTKIKN